MTIGHMGMDAEGLTVAFVLMALIVALLIATRR